MENCIIIVFRARYCAINYLLLFFVLLLLTTIGLFIVIKKAAVKEDQLIELMKLFHIIPINSDVHLIWTLAVLRLKNEFK